MARTPSDQVYNAVELDDLLTTSGIIPPPRLAELASLGFEVVIDLLPSESEHAVANESEIVSAQGLRYVHIPVDFQSPTREDFEAFCDAMDRAQGRRVWAHCAANYRVSAFVSLYRERRGMWSEADSAAFMASLWEPGGVWAEFIAARRAEAGR